MVLDLVHKRDLSAAGRPHGAGAARHPGVRGRGDGDEALAGLVLVGRHPPRHDVTARQWRSIRCTNATCRRSAVLTAQEQHAIRAVAGEDEALAGSCSRS